MDRWKFEPLFNDVEIHSDGDWVRYSDVERLEEEKDRAYQRAREANGSLDKIASLESQLKDRDKLLQEVRGEINNLPTWDIEHDGAAYSESRSMYKQKGLVKDEFTQGDYVEVELLKIILSKLTPKEAE